MILEFGTLRSECVLNASEGVSTRNGELESQVEFHNSIPIPYWASSNLQLCSDLVEHIKSIHVQLNLRTKDTLGTGLLSFLRRLSLSQRFIVF